MCEGHLVALTEPLTGMNKDGATTILGGAVGPPAAMRRRTAAMKRACGALIAEGAGTLVPLLWPDALTSSEIEWSAAFEADETEAAPVAFLCSGCAAHYAERRADVACVRCGVEFKVSLLVRGGRAELAKGDNCLVCREEDKLALATALGFGGAVSASSTPGVAADTFYTVGLDDLAPHHDATGLVMGAGAGANYEFIDIADGCAKKWRKCPRQVRDLHGTQLSVYVALPGIGTDYCSPGGTLGHRHSDMDYFHFVGTVRGLAVESNGSSIELYVPELNLRFDLSLADLDGDSDATDGPATRATLEPGDAVTSNPPGACLVNDCPALSDIIGPMDGWASQVGRAIGESPLGALKQKLESRRTSSAATWAAIWAGGAEGAAATPSTPSLTPASAMAEPGGRQGSASAETQGQSPPTTEQTAAEHGRFNAENKRFFDEVAHCDQARRFITSGQSGRTENDDLSRRSDKAPAWNSAMEETEEQDGWPGWPSAGQGAPTPAPERGATAAAISVASSATEAARGAATTPTFGRPEPARLSFSGRTQQSALELRTTRRQGIWSGSPAVAELRPPGTCEMTDTMAALWHVPRDPALVTKGAMAPPAEFHGTMPPIWVHEGHGRTQCSTILSVAISKLPPGYRNRQTTSSIWFAVVGGRGAMYQAFAHPIPYGCATHGVTRRSEYPGTVGYFETKTCVSYAAAVDHLTKRLRQRALGDGGGPDPTPPSPGAIAYASASVSASSSTATASPGTGWTFNASSTPRFPKGSGTDGCLYFYSHRGRGGWLSQFYESPFVSDGATFETAEKFMMASKARLMGDEAAVGHIMATTKPEDAKELGRRIAPWDEALWQAERFGIVSRGTELKFSQNPQLREWLLQTGDTTLVEASPYGKVWGIGLSIADAETGAKWRGMNLLGKALGEVREKFRAADAAADAANPSAGPSGSRASDEAATPTPAPAPTPSPTPTPFQPGDAAAGIRQRTLERSLGEDGTEASSSATPGGPKICRMGCGRAARHQGGSRGTLDLCCAVCYDTNAGGHADCCGEIDGASAKLKFGAGETDQAVVEVANEASARSAAAENSVAGVEARTAVLEAAFADDNARREATPDKASDERQIMRHKIIEIGSKQREARGAALGHKFSHTQAQALVILRMCGAQVAGESCAVGNGLTGYELFEALLLQTVSPPAERDGWEHCHGFPTLCVLARLVDLYISCDAKPGISARDTPEHSVFEMADTDGPGGDLTGPGLKLTPAMLKAQPHVADKSMSIDSWVKHRSVLSSFVGLLVGQTFKTNLDVSIGHLKELHKGRCEKYTVAKCDLLLVKVWNTTVGSAIQMRNNAGCDSDSPIAEVELLVGHELAAFGDSLQWPSLPDMPHLKKIEDRRDMLMDRRALDRLAVPRNGAVQRAGGDGDADAGNFQSLPAAPAGSPAPSGLAFRAGKHGTTISTTDPHMELVFRLPDSTRAALVGKNPVGAGGAQYCRICQTHGSVHGTVGSHKCNKANSQLPGRHGAIQPPRADPGRHGRLP